MYIIYIEQPQMNIYFQVGWERSIVLFLSMNYTNESRISIFQKLHPQVDFFITAQ